MKERLRRKLVRSWLKWVAHLNRTEGEGLTKSCEGRRGEGEEVDRAGGGMTV